MDKDRSLGNKVGNNIINFLYSDFRDIIYNFLIGKFNDFNYNEAYDNVMIFVCNKDKIEM